MDFACLSLNKPKANKDGAFAYNAGVFAITPKVFTITPKAFAITPKAFANFSPGFERSENPGSTIKKSHKTLKGLALGEPFQGFHGDKLTSPGFERSDPGSTIEKSH